MGAEVTECSQHGSPRGFAKMTTNPWFWTSRVRETKQSGTGRRRQQVRLYVYHCCRLVAVAERIEDCSQEKLEKLWGGSARHATKMPEKERRHQSLRGPLAREPGELTSILTTYRCDGLVSPLQTSRLCVPRFANMFIQYRGGQTG